MRESYRVGLYTLGCKVAQYETEAVCEAFEKMGFIRTNFEDVCDVYVINTCTVTAESNRKCRQMIRRAIKRNPDALVMVMGCYSQTTPEDILKIEGVSYISGTADKLLLPKRAAQLLEKRGKGEKALPVCEVSSLENAVFEDMRIEKTERTRAYVKIEDGCDCRCTYCAIPNARGPVRSKPMPDILEEIKALSKKGTKEIVLTGIEIASYGKDLGKVRLIDLLEEIERAGIAERIRLGSITPEILTEDSILRLKNISCLAPHLHISMQSGSDTILRAMKRRYNVKMAERSLSLLRTHIPDIMFTCDMIAGFPGETEENHNETASFMKRAEFLNAHVFTYSKRDNTPAAYYDGQLEESVKHERCLALTALQKEITDGILKRLTKEKKEMSAILETLDGNMITGHTASFVEIKAECTEDLRGQMRPVLPISHENGVLFCKIL